jgi:hypothetical protein
VLSVKAHDRERVSFAGIREQGFQARPLHRPAGTDIAENLGGAGLGQPHGLAGDILIASRHPRIAENGAMASRKRPLCGCGNMRISCGKFRSAGLERRSTSPMLLPVADNW